MENLLLTYRQCGLAHVTHNLIVSHLRHMFNCWLKSLLDTWSVQHTIHFRSKFHVRPPMVN